MTCKPGDLPWNAEGACHASLESGWYGSGDFSFDHPLPAFPSVSYYRLVALA